MPPVILGRDTLAEEHTVILLPVLVVVGVVGFSGVYSLAGVYNAEAFEQFLGEAKCYECGKVRPCVPLLVLVVGGRWLLVV